MDQETGTKGVTGEATVLLGLHESDIGKSRGEQKRGSVGIDAAPAPNASVATTETRMITIVTMVGAIIRQAASTVSDNNPLREMRAD